MIKVCLHLKKGEGEGMGEGGGMLWVSVKLQDSL